MELMDEDMEGMEHGSGSEDEEKPPEVIVPVKEKKGKKKGAGAKGKSPKKGGEQSIDPGLQTQPTKKSKKKKVKEIVIEVSTVIPPIVDNRCDRFMPNRAMMQKLVTKAAGLKTKDLDVEPTRNGLINEVRPWVKISNADMF